LAGHEATYFLHTYGMIWAVGNQLPIIKYQHSVAVGFYFIQIRRRKKEGCVLTTSPQQMAPNLLARLVV
jgi:hypothetical protein